MHYIESTDLEQHGTHALQGMDAILVPGGFGERGIEGKIQAVRFAREQRVPYLGLCLGMQIAIVEYGRHVLGFPDANSTEFNRASSHPVIALITEWQDQARGAQQRDEASGKGGTMRLGAQEVLLAAGSRVRELYGRDIILERHRHRYEFNNNYRTRFESGGFRLSGLSPDKRLVEFMELADHPFYVGTQAHPEFKSRPDRPHPLFRELIAAALLRAEGRNPQIPFDDAEFDSLQAVGRATEPVA